MFRRNIIANYLGQFYLIIIGIVMVPFYLQYLGAEAYGLVGFFVLMQSWMALLNMGLSPTISREVAKVKSLTDPLKHLEFKNLLHSLEFIFIVISFIVAFFIVFYSDFISQNWLKVESLDIGVVSYCISLMGIMIGIRFILSLYNSGVIGTEEQVWLNKANIIISTLRFVGVLLVFYFISTEVKYFFEYQLFITLLEFFVFSTKFYKIMNIGKFKLYFSYAVVKPILPFAMGIAYTGAIWIFLTQLDKLLLSSIIPLEQYGYFSLVGVIANGVLQISAPIRKAILPRMTNLLSQGKTDEMIQVYKKSTQIVVIFVFSLISILAVFSYEFLYAWTGNIEASLWAKDILFWYVLGNGILTIAAFQYYLQFAYGKLKLHVYYNTVSALLSIPLIVWSAYTYGAIGVAMVWFIFRLLAFLIWTPYIHHTFAPGIHRDWIFKDIMPIFLSTIGYILLLKYIDFSFDYSREAIFGLLILIGTLLFIVNGMASSEGRKMIINFIKNRLSNDK